MPWDNFFSTVKPIFHKIWILIVYSQLVFINEGSAEVPVIFVLDFYLLNLSSALGEFGQQIWMHFNFSAKFTNCFRQVQQVKVLNKDHEDLCWPLIDTHKVIVQERNISLTVEFFLSNFLGVILHPGWILPNKVRRFSRMFCLSVCLSVMLLVCMFVCLRHPRKSTSGVCGDLWSKIAFLILASDEEKR